VVKIEYVVSWIVAPCNVVVGHQLLEDHQPWRWRQHSPLKQWYPTTTLHSTITQKTSNSVMSHNPLSGGCLLCWRMYRVAGEELLCEDDTFKRNYHLFRKWRTVFLEDLWKNA
jgi:hypothetical protein